MKKTLTFEYDTADDEYLENELQFKRIMAADNLCGAIDEFFANIRCIEKNECDKQNRKIEEKYYEGLFKARELMGEIIKECEIEGVLD